MGILPQLSWAISEMAIPGVTAILSMITSKFFEDQESKNGARIAVAIRVISVVGILLFFVLPKIDDASRYLSASIPGGGLYDLNFHYRSPQTYHTMCDSTPFYMGNTVSNGSGWSGLMMYADAMRRATAAQLQPLVDAWDRAMGILGR